MSLNKEEKEKIFGQYGNNSKDTGSVDSQVALFTEKIKRLTSHLKINPPPCLPIVALLGTIMSRHKDQSKGIAT